MSAKAEPRAHAAATTPGTDADASGWKICIRRLEVMAQIGVHSHEHGRTQRVLVDVELDLGDAEPPREDRLAETVDYQAIARAAETIARQGHVQLVETLAVSIADWCLNDDPRVLSARVRVEKPEALPNARAAGCEIVRTRA